MASASVLAELAIKISAQNAEFGKALTNSQNQLKSFTNGIKSLGSAIGVSLGAAALFEGLKQVVGIASEFEHTMSELKAITGATGSEFDSLREDALRLGAATKFTASEVGKLQVAFGRLGFNTKEIIDATEATLDLAAATGEDLAKSADVAGSTVRGFGLEAKETQRVVDVMAESFNKTALGLDNFTEAMKYVAPIAAAANVSVEETTALLGVLADAGIRGSSAGTALRKIFGDLSKDGRPVAERLDELGKKGITLKDSFDEVGRTAQTALLVLTKNRDKTAELTRAFGDASGAAASMARVMQDDLIGDTDKLTSAFEGLFLKLTKTDALRNLTQALTGLVNALSGTQGDVIQGLDQLAKGVKDGVEETNGGFQLLVDKIKEIRRETGKPIDTRVAQELADKYKLTEEQANVLYRTILDINSALGFQETAVKQFEEFVKRNSYQDLGKAADDYKNRLYELILAEQIRKAGLEKTNVDNVFDKEISGANKTISEYRKVINIINDYVGAHKTAEKEVQQATEATIINLNYYQEALKKVNEAFESLALAQDSSGRFTEKTLSNLRVLAAEGAGLEDFIQRVNRLKESFKNFDVIIKPPDLKPLTDGLQTITETAGALTFEKEVTSFEAMVLRFEEGMKKLVKSSKEGTEEVKGAFIDFQPLISGAISGIGEALGGAISGTENFGQSILKVVAGFAKQLGEILIATGTAMLAAKKLITNPYTAIIAGIALVALASAAGAAISKAHSNSFGGGSTSERTGSNVQAINRLVADPQRIEVVGELKGEGTSLKATLDAVDRRRQRTG